jgi:hypothetical protein
MIRIARFLMVFFLGVSWLGIANVTTVAAARPEPATIYSSAQANVPLGNLLNPDGTLKRTNGFSGSVNATGWRLVSGPHDAPQFAPLALTAPGPGNENWSPGFQVPDINNIVYAIAIAPNGDIYIGGRFTMIGTATFNRVARWDGSTWQRLSNGNNNGVNNIVWSLTFDSTGNLIAGGQFTTAGGVTANRVARWNGTNWSALGTGVNNTVYALASDGLGNVYAGGQFTTAGGNPANRVAVWNGTAWANLGSGMDNNIVYALTYGGGNLYAGGSFTALGGVTINRVAVWNGTTWAGLGSGIDNNIVYALAYGAGNLYAGGSFTRIGGAVVNRMAIWNGTAWAGLGSGGASSTVRALCFLGGNLYAGGDFTRMSGVNLNRAAFWNGTAWNALGDGFNSSIYTLAMNGTGSLFAGGAFAASGTNVVVRLGRWNGTLWAGVTPGGAGNGADNTVYALALDANGDVYVGGAFFSVGSTLVNYVARWDGANWFALGSGMNNIVRALALDSSGNLYAGGDFTTAGGITANRVARWNGSTWNALGAGMNNRVYALALDGLGNLYVGGQFTTAGVTTVNRVARWDGTTWNALGSGTVGVDDLVYALSCDNANQVYAGGAFLTAGGITVNRVARWDGTAWNALTAGVNIGVNNIVWSLAVDTNNNMYAGGQFTTAGGVAANRVARWNGSTWSALGSGVNNTVRAMGFDSARQFYVTGDFTTAGGATASRIARWNGTTWSALGNGLSSTGSIGYAVASQPVQGNLFTGGSFASAGAANNYAANIASWSVAVGSNITATITYTLYSDNLPLQIGVTTLGSLSRINVQRYNRDHPNATVPLQTDYYWEIEGLDSSGNPATGFTVNLTLPTTYPPTANDKVCRYAGGVWNCVMTSFDADSITRNGITAFSDWATGNEASPTAIHLVSFQAEDRTPWAGWLVSGLVLLGLLWLTRRLAPHKL